MIELLPPGLLLVLGAFVVAVLPRIMGLAVALALPLVGLAHMWMWPENTGWQTTMLGLSLDLVRIDGWSRVFGTVFHIAAFLSVVFSLHVRDRIQHVSGMLYAGAAIGAAFAADLVTLFIYWELTAIGSVFLIWARRTERAMRVGVRYLLIQVASGVLLLAGAMIHARQTGSIAFDAMSLDHLGPQLIFLSFGIKAAFPFLHNWLQDAYPEATVTGTVWLSAFTTKLAIYALGRGFAGTEILIPIGAMMTAFPIFYAVIENDLRRVLAYSLNNQLGYMVVGIGIGTELALNGAAGHAFAHILYKGLLFMSMGAVLYRTGTANGSDLGGLYKTMPWTTAFCIIGACAISAFPLFSGFVTKSMILTAAAEEHHTVVFLVLLFASAGVFHHSGIKIPFFAFFAHDSGKRPEEAPWNMRLAMAGAAFLCVAIGVYPQPLYDLLPYAVNWEAYTSSHVVTQLQLLLFSALAFVFLQKVGWYPPELRSTNLDFDWTYRRLAPSVVGFIRRATGATARAGAAGAASVGTAVGQWAAQEFSPRGRLGEPWPIGGSSRWIVLALGAWVFWNLV